MVSFLLKRMRYTELKYSNLELNLKKINLFSKKINRKPNQSFLVYLLHLSKPATCSWPSFRKITPGTCSY